MKIWLFAGAAVLLAFGASQRDVRVMAAAPIACESLRQISLANGTLTAAESVQAGAFTPPTPPNANAASTFKTTPAFCRISARLTPSSDSDIRVEVWLPLSGWNRKLQALGNGGLGGTIPYPALSNAVKAGYAAVATDTGHVGGNGDFVAGHPEKLVDFAHRAIHEMTVSAKTLVAAHYDTRPAKAYFNSCSTGGRQALIEAQRYPEDFDGIVAGDPSWDQMRLYAARVYLNVYVNREPSAVIPPTKYPMIHDAVLNACDAKDGVKDGVIENPPACSFDFAALTCKGDDAADCLTKPQVETAKAMSSPITDRKSGAVLHPGRYYPGSELGWGGVAGPTPSGESHEGMKKIVFNPDWDYHTIKVPEDVERAVRADNGLLRRRSGSQAFLQPRRQAADVSRLGGSAGVSGHQPDHVQADHRRSGTVGFELPRAVHGSGNGSLPGWTRHGRFRQSCRDRSMGRVGCQAAVDCRVAHDGRDRGSHAAAVCVSRDCALRRYRQHRRGSEFPLPDREMKIGRRSCSR
jgi:hypothetical protein